MNVVLLEVSERVHEEWDGPDEAQCRVDQGTHGEGESAHEENVGRVQRDGQPRGQGDAKQGLRGQADVGRSHNHVDA